MIPTHEPRCTVRKSGLIAYEEDVFFRNRGLSTTEPVEVVRDIPDGMHLATFPSHLQGSDCWCRPRMVSSPPLDVRLCHKNLSTGEFDS